MLSSDDSLFDRTPLDSNRITELLELCLRSTYFSYKGVFYEQTEGAAMGSPVSAVVANLYMQFFEEMALRLAPVAPKLWKRYVDDVFCIIKSGEEKILLKHLNSLRDSIKFTMETEESGSIAFLDCHLHRTENSKLTVSVYRKKTHTDKYLNFDSHHPVHVKKGVVKCLYNRAKKVTTSSRDLGKEERHLNQVLLSNGYPQSFITSNSRERSRVPQDRDEVDSSKLIAIPYVSGLSEDIRRICRRFDIRVVFRSGPTLRSQLTKLKDKLPIETRSGVVYRIPCSSCDRSYIGETIRRLGDRVKEHKKACVRCETVVSAIAEHAWNEGHPIAWENTKVIGTDNRRMGLVIKEAMLINSDRGPLLNRDTGLDLPGCWHVALKDHLRMLNNTHAQ